MDRKAADGWMVAAVAVIIRFTFRPRILVLFMVALPPFNPLRSGSCHASNLDGGQESNSGRLHRGRTTVQRGRSCSCKVPLRSSELQSVGISFTSPIAQSKGSRGFVSVVIAVIARANRDRASYVRSVPNITGKVTNIGLNFSETESVGSTWGTKEGWWGGSNDDNYKTTLNLDASRSSTVYGRSTTVQPPSLRLLPCIKV